MRRDTAWLWVGVFALGLCGEAGPGWPGGGNALAAGRVSRGISRNPKAGKVRYPTWGAPDAPVAVWLFADLQCPFSRRLVERVVPRLLQRYPGKVRVVFRHFPLRFHRQAFPAAMAVQEVFRQRGSAAAWRFIRTVFAHQRQIDEGRLVAWAVQAGADGAKVRAALRTGRHRARVDAEIAVGKRLGVRGTPSAFLFRGADPARGLPAVLVRVRGAQPYHRVEAEVRRVLGK